MNVIKDDVICLSKVNVYNGTNKLLPKELDLRSPLLATTTAIHATGTTINPLPKKYLFMRHNQKENGI